MALITLLLIFSVITLRKILQGSKSKFGIKIVKSYIVYCVSDIIMMVFFLILRKELSNEYSVEFSWRFWLCAISY